MNHKDLKGQIERFTEKKLALFISGRPGVGKSWLVRECAQEMARDGKREFVDWAELSMEEKLSLMGPDGMREAMDRGLVESRARQLAESDPFVYAVLNMVENDLTDIKGILALADTGRSSRFADWRPPMLMAVLARKGRKGLLFLDEITQTQPENLSPAFKLVLDRVAGDLKLADGVRVVAAGNGVEDHSASYEMPMALRNRFGHAELSPPSGEEWSDWALSNDLDMRVAAFVRSSPGSVLEEVSKARAGKGAYATPRSWHQLANLILGNSDIQAMGADAVAMVGGKEGLAFKGFLKNTMTIDYERFIRDPVGCMAEWAKDAKTFTSMRFAATIGLASKVKEDKRLMSAALDVGLKLTDDLAILLIKGLMNVDKTRLTGVILKHPSLPTIASKYLKYTGIDLKASA